MDKNTISKFNGYAREGNQFLALPNNVSIQCKLSPGSYKLSYNRMSQELRFELMEFNHDSIIALPSIEYERVTKELAYFLKPETKQLYIELGFIYKRSALLYGRPGTGKTMIVNRIVKDVVNMNGIVLWTDDAYVASLALSALDSTQKETFVAVVFEEFDSMIEDQESYLLSLLDGQVQKDGVMYLATTNYINKIPKRIMRPGRFATVQQVNEPTIEARVAYLNAKLSKLETNTINAIASATEGMTIDELKEVVQAHILLGNTLTDAVNNVKRAGPMEDKKFLNNIENF